MPTDSPTLFDRVGGREELPRIVEEFYRRVLADPLLAPFFEEVDMERLKLRQIRFLTSVFDGPGTASGEDLAAAHHGRGIEREHVSAFVEHLADVLEQHGVQPHDVDDVRGRLATYVPEITGRPISDG
ncbi:group I truncated hemoglobin [Candidatus Laterigemmans baculatus]|uniref:group I truncated hemoglobin n=1 Tax=Candidatus Laterigemmans baculatus TaxID=2770505 RepID=UPI0013DA0653|nr:group 1 truncated hemoglobin [Candidatus Laterigemmans baculatus]